jgi:twinkle protein
VVLRAPEQVTTAPLRAKSIALGAGTGVGKTDFLTQQIEFDLRVLKLTVGSIYLEQPPEETCGASPASIRGQGAPRPRRLDPEEREAAIAVAAHNASFLYDHFGACRVGRIKARIRYINKALRLQASSTSTTSRPWQAGEEDEKQALEEIMAEHRGQAQELATCSSSSRTSPPPRASPTRRAGA